MPVTKAFNLPSSPELLPLPADSENATTFFISFHASVDPNTGKPWCPDVVAAIPHLEEVFSAPGSPDVAFVEVGQKPEWRDLSNVYRTKWNVNNVPTLVRFENVNGTVNETGRLVEGDILDRKKLGEFVLKEPGNAGA
ncbi:hypothetical protein AN8630.2 [Aspergillus nidulans FGSC A4]|uniref:Thioredoxin domain-containing protein n=1 Tax=Emericella nidulans (strain FGSC A4 / ATCC 38163 / CBS 112.46 / NRRL 194 / M139) TaxID=227321 RepID=Q5ASV0_EMENI|nr:hypothetical protein [Aspergillus nidulans FGSC A4]EAA60664.1 hypothetical protein AN8630.2 [Aspergillus nidulans FGSC A4]CBF78296.1 TPA: conserved hypothetical protein [Aspergillus nidulans FGSC A4]|eukprot:XP_681899.1 hypothetical protein AN8630.2 [Aspergillus nidulans FGSC A4]